MIKLHHGDHAQMDRLSQRSKGCACLRSVTNTALNPYPGDVGGEADGGGAAAGGVDAPRRQLVHRHHQLRLAGARVAHQQHVQLAAHPPARELLRPRHGESEAMALVAQGTDAPLLRRRDSNYQRPKASYKTLGYLLQGTAVH